MLRRIRDLKVANKLFLLLFISILSLLISLTIGNMNSMNMKKRAEALYEEQMIPSFILNQLSNLDNEMNQLVREGLSTKEFSKIEQSIQKINDEKIKLINEYKELASETNREENYIDEYLVNITKSKELQEQLFTLNLEGKATEAYTLYLGDFRLLQDKNTEIISHLLELKKLAATDLNEKNKKDGRNFLLTLIFITVLAVIVQIIIGSVIKDDNRTN